MTVYKNVDICWCHMEADYYGDIGLEKCNSEILEQFARTAPFMSVKAFNFFPRNEQRPYNDRPV